MQLATITAPPEEAKAKLDEYKASVAATHDEVDRQIMKGYEALAKGLSLIRLHEAIASGGSHETGLPKLAVGRMTDPRINVRVHAERVRFFPASMGDWVRNENAGLNSGVVNVQMERGPWHSGLRDRASAIMPLVPPSLRPARARHRYFVLFEADWLPEPPSDPALIRHLVGDLWIVLSTWDLTELERAAIAGR